MDVKKNMDCKFFFIRIAFYDPWREINAIVQSYFFDLYRDGEYCFHLFHASAVT